MLNQITNSKKTAKTIIYTSLFAFITASMPVRASDDEREDDRVLRPVKNKQGEVVRERINVGAHKKVLRQRVRKAVDPVAETVGMGAEIVGTGVRALTDGLHLTAPEVQPALGQRAVQRTLMIGNQGEDDNSKKESRIRLGYQVSGAIIGMMVLTFLTYMFYTMFFSDNNTPSSSFGGYLPSGSSSFGGYLPSGTETAEDYLPNSLAIRDTTFAEQLQQMIQKTLFSDNFNDYMNNCMDQGSGFFQKLLKSMYYSVSNAQQNCEKVFESKYGTNE